MKLGHTREDWIRETAKNLHYIIKGVLEVCMDCAMKKKQKIPHKVVEERYIKTEEMIYLITTAVRSEERRNRG